MYDNTTKIALIKKAGINYSLGTPIDISKIYQVIEKKDLKLTDGTLVTVCVLKNIGIKR